MRLWSMEIPRYCKSQGLIHQYLSSCYPDVLDTVIGEPALLGTRGHPRRFQLESYASFPIALSQDTSSLPCLSNSFQLIFQLIFLLLCLSQSRLFSAQQPSNLLKGMILPLLCSLSPNIFLSHPESNLRIL